MTLRARNSASLIDYELDMKSKMTDISLSDTPAEAFVYFLYHKKLVTSVTRECKSEVSLFFVTYPTVALTVKLK